jgi:TonB family protein
MRGVCVVVRAILPALLLTSTGVSSQPTLLEPVGKWDLDYGETQCGAYRNYGKAENPVTFAIVPSPNGETYEIVVARRSPAPEFAEELQGSVDFGHGPVKAWLLHFRSVEKRLDVYQFRIAASEMAQARTASSVTLHIEGAPDFAFSLEAIPDLLSGLENCIADLKDYWNMDGEKDGRIARAAQGDLRGLFSASDYPQQAVVRRQQGDTRFLLLVDEKGKVAACQVLLASGVPVLDAMGCAKIQDEARFKPALDRDGKPVRSTVVTPQVKWRLR